MQGVHADDATTDNRMLQTRTPAYRWMVANASRFGFVNYAFEPWHWEYVKGPLPATTPPEPIVANAATPPAATPGGPTSIGGAAAAASVQGAIVTLPTAKPQADPARPQADMPEPHP
jgi:hypothetical protein